MVAAAWGGAAHADLVMVLVDAAKCVDRDTRSIIDRLKKSNRRALLVLNKVDLVQKPILLDRAAALNAEDIFTDIFMLCATTGDGVGDFVARLSAILPEGPWLFPEDQLSDMPERLLAAEITREKLYLELHQELPYQATVETEGWSERDDGSVRIDQVIFVERSSQKGIVLGKGGQRIKSMGEASRRELEEILARRVHLLLFVKVRQNWGDDPERYRDWGLDFNA
jgi:GTP-binding protein Era